ncbi:MAG: exopolyphosphatase [Magnetococcales bacterium]|nr:exopolyphosphatase [Magnetococcales bacterium]MBF0156617.1 exopolyphosphatase [Magnetococcales bacterium]
MAENKKFRLVTRSDFDGLVCAVLLKELNLVEDIKFVHPKDMQDGKVEVTNQDITTNLPYVEGVHLAFDHHLSETLRGGGVKPKNHIIDPNAPSAARVVYDYYGGKKKFPNVSDDMMAAVDKSDAAQFSREEILNPGGWDLLNFIMDARTGLGRFRTFRVSNYQLMMQLIDYCREWDIEDILGLPDVRQRVDRYFDHEEKFKEQIEKCSRIEGNVIILDLREEETIWAGNRFMIYAMHPEINVSIHVLWGFKKQNVALPIGKSIINRSCQSNVGELCLKYGGGGHANAGTCQVPTEDAERVIQELVAQLVAKG